MWISIFKVWSNKNSDRRWTNLSSYLVTLDTRHLRADGISGKRRPRPPGPGAWPRPLVMFLTPVPLSGGSGPPQVLGHVKKLMSWKMLWMLGSWTEMSSVDDGSDSANAIDDDNTTSAITRDGEEWRQSSNNFYVHVKFSGSFSGHSFPFFLLDIGRNIRLSKVSFLGGDSPQDNPIMNVDLRFGYNSNSGFNPNSKITNNERWEANCYICKLENLTILRQDVELILVLLLFKVNGLR